MRKYRVSFSYKGQFRETVIFAHSTTEACELVRLQFPGASSIGAVEIR